MKFSGLNTVRKIPRDSETPDGRNDLFNRSKLLTRPGINKSNPGAWDSAINYLFALHTDSEIVKNLGITDGGIVFNFDAGYSFGMDPITTTPTAGVPFDITFRAYRDGGPDKDYDGTIDLDVSDGTISPDEITDFVDGVKTEEITISDTTERPVKIITTDQEDPTKKGELTIKVNFLYEDAMVFSNTPTVNYGDYDWISTHIHRSDIGVSLAYRTFIKTPGSGNKTLHLYCYYSNKDVANWRPIGAYAVTSSWSEGIITWNNKPSYGSLLDSTTVNATGWWTWDIGTANSVCLKFIDESFDSAGVISAHYRSKEYTESSYRPYLTEA